ncbi:AN1-like Zinc finger [Halogranum gelatinilyticum]|uniref:AN1-like Zinc finger n=1 Tax=Halogranum gelatinilyticum TaxID=660521 RepID=A0A1G9QD31_9EURY|nr:AN1-type zinc finger domain-containing protein [Halogranum gelatinilyticum]SDM08938.1 AN1-like Zinc finger [Halogranum gelatinilyticum]
MVTCERCGETLTEPRPCSYCGSQFCADHRLPESHDCAGLDEWRDTGGHFDSGFDDSMSAED